MKRIKKISYLFFAIFLFCAIFTPDFFSFSMRYIVIIICSAGIIWNWLLTKKIVFNKNFLSIFLGFLPFCIWLIIIQLIHIIIDFDNASVYIGTIVHTLSSFVAAFLIGLFLIYLCKKLKLNLNDFFNLIILVMIVQFVCVLFSLMFPEVRLFFNSFIVRNSYSERLVELAMASNAGRTDRSYGLSNNLFDSFGYITALLICLIFIIGMEKKNIKLMVLSTVMILMPLVNARTGVVLALIGIIFASAFYVEPKILIRNFGLLVLAFILFGVAINRLPESMVQWIKSGIQETQSLITGVGNIGVYSKIFGTDLIFPSSILIGDGGLPRDLISYGVDNGYINCIWNFGLIGTVFLLSGYFHMFRLVYKKFRSKMYRTVSFVFGVLFYLYLIKVYSIDNFGGIVIIFGISIIMLTSEIDTVPS